MTGTGRRANGTAQVPSSAPSPAALLVRFVAVGYLTIVLSMASWTLLPLLVHWQPVVVLSGSMEPVIHTGDVVLFERTSADNLIPGQLVLVDDPNHPGGLLSHRLVRRRDDGFLITKGDANRTEDSTPVAPDRVHGRGRLLVPYLGRTVLWHDGAWLQTLPWLVALAGAIVVLLAGRADERNGDADQRHPERDGDGGDTGLRRARLGADQPLVASQVNVAAALSRVRFSPRVPGDVGLGQARLRAAPHG